MQTHANEAMYDGGSRGWSPSCTCFIISIFSNGTWLTREPPCRIFFQTVSNQTQTLSFPFDVTSLPARFSQSVRREPFRIFSDLVIIPFLSGLIEVFCTQDAFHIWIRNDCSEQVCGSCWIRQGGMNPSGNAFLSRMWVQRPDVWIYTFNLVIHLSKVKQSFNFQLLTHRSRECWTAARWFGDSPFQVYCKGL